MLCAQPMRAPALHPYTRHLIRWRAQHLATTARALHQGQERWETTKLPRYLLYDGRTNEHPTPSASPRIRVIPSHHRVWIPPAHTNPFTCGLHHIDLTPFLLADAEDRMSREGAIDAWEAFLNNPHPPVIFRPHARDGIVPSDEVRFNGSLKTAVGIIARIATHRDELGGNE